MECTSGQMHFVLRTNSLSCVAYDLTALPICDLFTLSLRLTCCLSGISFPSRDVGRSGCRSINTLNRSLQKSEVILRASQPICGVACLRLNIRLWLSPFYACRCVSRRKRDFFHSYRVLILSLQYKAIRANGVSAAVRLNTPPNAGTRAETAWPVGISKFRTLNIRNTVSSRVEPPPLYASHSFPLATENAPLTSPTRFRQAS